MEVNRNFWTEKVAIELFKDNGKYKDAVTVGWNGRMYQIERGKRVEIPRAVYEILMQSREQDIKTAEMIEEKQAEYDNLARAQIL